MKQTKIAISIDPYILGEIEKRIDGNAIKNRSQAIEYLLRKALLSNASTAIILAGGDRGEDKAMRTHDGKPILEHLIKWMLGYGIHKFVIALRSDESRIRAYFGDGSKFNANILYLLESNPVGTAGAVKACMSLVGPVFIVANCDSIFGFNLIRMLDYHNKLGKVATIAVREKQNPSEYGCVEMEGYEITSFSEKQKHASTRIVNTGLYIMNKQVKDFLPDEGMLERDVFPVLASKGALAGYMFTSEWMDTERES